MISTMKEICIFMIIVQGILCFVPGNSYVKYVRILIGIIMILRITEPIFNLLTDSDVRQEIDRKIKGLEESIALGQQELEIEDDKMGIYNSIEEELKERLKSCEGDYIVRKVELVGEEGTEGAGEQRIPSGDNLRIMITVSSEESKDTIPAGKGRGGDIKIEPVMIGRKKMESAMQDEKLKEQYSECIGVNGENIEIIFQEGWQ